MRALCLGSNPLLAAGLVLAVLYRRDDCFGPVQQMALLLRRMPFLFLLRDLMLPIVYVDAWVVNDFVWRGNEMTMREKERPST